MGRVYEALKRAADQNGPEAGAAAEVAAAEEKGIAPAAEPNGNGHAHAPAAPEAGHAPEYLFSASRHFQTPETAHTTAPNEQTLASGGSALPAGQASRAAGATLGAAGSARTPGFVSLDVSAARVEPHLVAVTQPRSSHAERFRSLRTRVLHAGERRKMQAFVITSAGVMEGKTLTALNLSWLLAQTDGVRALLIDGDLRNPCAADYFGLGAPVGLSEVLGGETSLHEAIVRLEPAGLHECVQEAVTHGGGFRQSERLHRRPQRLRFLESHARQLQAPASGEAGRGSTVRVVIHRGEHQADGQCVVQLDASELGRRGADEQWIAGGQGTLEARIRRALAGHR